jgi:SAM-dependent methyltransferase
MRSGNDGIANVVRRHWDGRASTFDEEIGHGLLGDEQRHAWLDLLSRLVGRAPQRVLDVGCGTGFLALRFAELGHVVTGIDLSQRMIDRARRKAEQAAQQIDFRVGEADALDSDDEMYDVVVARHVIWLLPEPERGVAEWLRVLRPRGRLALIEGKWADNDALALSYARPASQFLGHLMDAAASFAPPRSGGYPRRLLNRRYRRIEALLPFSGGAPATELAELLEASSVHDIVVEPLMDPRLWNGRPEFLRYVVSGTR